MKIIMMGPQGCGKGTIGKMLSQKTGLPLVTVGKLLRDVPKDNPHYKSVNDAMNAGELAPFKIVAALFISVIANSSYIFLFSFA